MKVSLDLTPEEAAETLVAAASSNGHAAEKAVFLDAQGQPVNVAVVRIVCDNATMSVRCTPESDLSSLIRRRQEYAMQMLNGSMQGGDDVQSDS